MAPGPSSLSNASFRSAISYTSYRSCASQSSFRSCVSSSFKSCQGTPVIGEHNQGYEGSDDNVSFCSVTDSLPEVGQEGAGGEGATVCDLGEIKEEAGVTKDEPKTALVYLGYVFAIVAGIIFTAR